jgi:hypothetical protein
MFSIHISFQFFFQIVVIWLLAGRNRRVMNNLHELSSAATGMQQSSGVAWNRIHSKFMTGLRRSKPGLSVSIRFLVLDPSMSAS